MKILIVRHGNAEERENWNAIGKSDFLRPLTKKGLYRFAETVKGLSHFVDHIDYIYSSQLTRAVQTMDILQGYYHQATHEIIKELNPGEGYKKMEKLLSIHKNSDVIALVGHQPELSLMCSHFISSDESTGIRFKKGGIALINYENGHGELQWLLTQKQLSYLSEFEEKEELK
jgi:phosphohistidine phosphatase